MRGRRRRRLLCDCVTSKAYGKRSRDDEGLDHGSKPSNFVHSDSRKVTEKPQHLSKMLTLPAFRSDGPPVTWGGSHEAGRVGQRGRAGFGRWLPG
jgi:hypothetical protein